MFTTKNDGVPVAYYDYRGKKTILRYDESTKVEHLADDSFIRAIHGGKLNQTQIEVHRYNLAENTEFSSYTAPNDVNLRLIPPSIASQRERDVYFLSGQSGSGKSYLSAQLLETYRLAGRRVYVITDVKDKKFGKCEYLDIDDLVVQSGEYEEAKEKYEEAKIKFKHRKKMLDDPEAVMNLEILLNKMKPKADMKKRLELVNSEEELGEMLMDSVILFDDYENNKDASRISFLRDTILTKGRHWNCSMIICNHLTNFGSGSRLIMAETTNFVLFNKASPRTRSYFLKNYLEFGKEDRELVKEALKESRWVCIDRHLAIQLSQHSAWAGNPVA